MSRVNYRGYRNTYATSHAEAVIFKQLTDIERTLNTLEDAIKKNGYATLAEYYKLTCGKVYEEDTNWGWTDLLGCNISICRYGYELHMPMTKVLNIDPKEEIIDMLHDALNKDDMGIVSDAIDRLSDTL